MYRLLLALVVLALSRPAVPGPPSDAEDSVSGTTTCDSSDNTGLCRIAWNIHAATRTFHWIEEMDPETSTWRRISGPVSARSGITEEPVLGGRLYRVVACEDPTGAKECIGSTVLWAPFQPKSADAIPSFLDDKRGVRMFVSKNLSLEEQNQQYNAYLLVRLMNGVTDMRAMPPMTVPRFGPVVPDEVLLAEGTNDDIIQQTLYAMYEARRTSKAAR